MTRTCSARKRVHSFTGGGLRCRLKKAEVLRDVFPEQVSVERLQLDQACAVCQGDFSEDGVGAGTQESSMSRRIRPPEASRSEQPCSPLCSDDRFPSSGSAGASGGHDLGAAPELLPLGLISGCFHSFHHVCIQSWGFQQNTCPQCKRRFRWLACYSREGHRMGLAYVRHKNLKVDSSEVSSASGGAVCPVCQEAIEGGGGIISCDGCSVLHHVTCSGAPVNRSVLLNGLWFCRNCVGEGRCVDREGQHISPNRLTAWGFYESSPRRSLRRAQAATSNSITWQHSSHQGTSRGRRLSGRLVRPSSYAGRVASRSNNRDVLGEVLDRSVREADEAWQQYHSGANTGSGETVSVAEADDYGGGFCAQSTDSRAPCRDGTGEVSDASAVSSNDERRSADAIPEGEPGWFLPRPCV